MALGDRKTQYTGCVTKPSITHENYAPAPRHGTLRWLFAGLLGTLLSCGVLGILGQVIPDGIRLVPHRLLAVLHIPLATPVKADRAADTRLEFPEKDR